MLNINTLITQSCQPIKQGTSAMVIPTIESYLSILSGWQAAFDYKSIERTIRFKNHYQVMSFLNALAYISQQQDHYAQICYSYNQIDIKLHTPNAKGVSLNDMIIAAHINQLHANE